MWSWCLELSYYESNVMGNYLPWVIQHWELHVTLLQVKSWVSCDICDLHFHLAWAHKPSNLPMKSIYRINKEKTKIISMCHGCIFIKNNYSSSLSLEGQCNLKKIDSDPSVWYFQTIIKLFMLTLSNHENVVCHGVVRVWWCLQSYYLS